MSFDETYSFRAEAGATRVELRAEMQPAGLYRILAPIMRIAFGRQVRQDHIKLKRLLEG